jgi:hypothetical protein
MTPPSLREIYSSTGLVTRLLSKHPHLTPYAMEVSAR